MIALIAMAFVVLAVVKDSDRDFWHLLAIAAVIALVAIAEEIREWRKARRDG